MPLIQENTDSSVVSPSIDQWTYAVSVLIPINSRSIESFITLSDLTYRKVLVVTSLIGLIGKWN